jgi:hypothetical protein
MPAVLVFYCVRISGQSTHKGSLILVLVFSLYGTKSIHTGRGSLTSHRYYAEYYVANGLPLRVITFTTSYLDRQNTSYKTLRWFQHAHGAPVVFVFVSDFFPAWTYCRLESRRWQLMNAGHLCPSGTVV